MAKKDYKEKGKTFMDEFKTFIMRGNVLDMAVGVIIGGAFTAIVTSLNEDILTPVLGVFGGTDFSNLVITLGSGDAAPVIRYGNFITALINFVIIAFTIFLLIKLINSISDKMSKKEKEVKPTTKKCNYCQSDIAIEAKRCPLCTSILDKSILKDFE